MTKAKATAPIPEWTAVNEYDRNFVLRVLMDQAEQVSDMSERRETALRAAIMHLTRVAR